MKRLKGYHAVEGPLVADVLEQGGLMLAEAGGIVAATSVMIVPVASNPADVSTRAACETFARQLGQAQRRELGAVSTPIYLKVTACEFESTKTGSDINQTNIIFSPRHTQYVVTCRYQSTRAKEALSHCRAFVASLEEGRAK